MSALSSVRGLGSSSSSSRYYDPSPRIRLAPIRSNSGQTQGSASGSSGSGSFQMNALNGGHLQNPNLLQARNPLISEPSLALSNYSRDHSVPWYKSPEQIQLILVKNLFIVINLAIVGSSLYVLSMSDEDFWRPDNAIIILGLIFGIILCVIGIFGGLKDEDYLVLTYSLVALVFFILLSIYHTKELIQEILMGLYVLLCFYFSYLLHRKQKVVEIEKQIPLVHAVMAASKNSLKFTTPAIASHQMMAAADLKNSPFNQTMIKKVPRSVKTGISEETV